MASVPGRVMILAGGFPLPDDEQAARCQLLQLPNPSTGQQQQYVLTSKGLLEINRIKQAATCWLVGDTFVSDGNAFMASPINVVFVLLALLDSQHSMTSAAEMYQEAETLLCNERWPAAQQLLGLAQQHLPCICDVKTLDEMPYYRFNPQKVLAFLRVAVSKFLAAFKSHSPGSIAGLPPDEQQHYILRFIREYLSQAWHEGLLRSYGLDPATFGSADASSTIPVARPPAEALQQIATAEKRHKVIDPKEAARKKAEESRAATAVAKLGKQAAGSKKISQFFAAVKPKK